MPVVKLNVSLDSAVAEKLKWRAAELQKPTSRYLAELIEEEVQRSRDEAAVEGYRLLSGDTASFADAAAPIAAETWPKWEEKPATTKRKKRKGAANG